MATATNYLLTALPGVQAWFKRMVEGGALLEALGRVLVLLAIVVGARLLVKVAETFVNRLFQPERHVYLDERRVKTLSTLIASIAQYVIYFFAGVMVLQNLGFNTTSILTAAGIGGLAIGFGAQNLVRDVITGFFILFEDQYGVGDLITAGGVTGIVEEMGIRITKIRDPGGQLHIIPNGQITQVTNHMGPSMRVMFDVEVSYGTDLEQAITVLQQVLEEYAQGNDRLVEAPAVLGVQELGESGVAIRVLARTRPMEQWGVERELKRLIKERFDAQGIEIPFPHRMLIVKGSGPAGPEPVLTGRPEGEGKP